MIDAIMFAAPYAIAFVLGAITCAIVLGDVLDVIDKKLDKAVLDMARREALALRAVREARAVIAKIEQEQEANK